MRNVLLLVLTTFTVNLFAQNLQTVKTYYDPYTKTQLYEVYTVLAGTPTKQGAYKVYDKQGILVKESTYINGIANGPYKEYYSSEYNLDFRGKIGLSSNYKKGQLDGTYEEYTYQGGRKCTKMTETYAAGVLVKEIDYKYYDDGKKGSSDDAMTGDHTEWYESGKLRAQELDSAKFLRSAKYYDEAGRVQMRVDQQTPGVYGLYVATTLDASGHKTEEAQCRQDKPGAALYREGSYVTYYPQGNKQEEGQYRGGKKVGIWKTYAEDGSVQSTHEFK
jgi:antitoxin component YwqK of YwqJK toxin-antitoxin module